MTSSSSRPRTTHSDQSRWQTPLPSGKTRKDILRKRHVILRCLRQFFEQNDFYELESPLLVRGTTPDAAITCFSCPSSSDADRYLVSSTEYQIKRLMAGGFDKVFTLTKNFRAGEQTKRHNPEFTMLEWARLNSDLEQIENDAVCFVTKIAAEMNLDEMSYNGYACAIAAPWDKITVKELLGLSDFSLQSFQDAARRESISLRPGQENDIVFLFTVLLGQVEKELGTKKPVFVRDWPIFLTSSAAETIDSHGEKIVERSELFIAGLEISDGFPFMRDHKRQQETFRDQNARRGSEGLPPVEIDHFYLDMMSNGLPQGAGMALGFDRLVMLMTGQNDIRHVLPYAWDEV